MPDRLITGSLRRQKDTMAALGFDGVAYEHAGFDEYDFQDLLHSKYGGRPPDPVMRDRKTHFRTLRDTVLDWQRDAIDEARESWGEFSARVAAARDYAMDTDARRVLVVSSGGVIGQLVATTLQAPSAMMMELNLQVKNASLHRFVFSKGRIMLTEFNATPHFDGQPDLLSYS